MLLSALESGDVLMVTRLDRLARSTRDLLNALASITERGAGFRSLGDPWALIWLFLDAVLMRNLTVAYGDGTKQLTAF